MTHLSLGNSYKILLLEGVHPGAVDLLRAQGYQVETENHALAGRELVARAQGFHALGIRSKTQISHEVLSEARTIQVIGAFCIGTNQIDLEYANIRGVPVFNAPYSNTRSVAELVISEMIALARSLGDINSAAHQGIWKKSAKGRHEIRGKTLGIVGYGHIGSQVSVLAESMGLKVVFFDVVKKLPLGNAQPLGSLNELLKQADFISLHVPETDLTMGMIGTQQFAKMKKGVFLINASRGTVVDIPNLVVNLKSGQVGGAAVDVFPHEPESNNEKFTSELQGIENVILTPHIGGSTEEAQAAIGLEVAESFTRYLSHGSSAGAVNFPSLEVPSKRDGDRLINVHKNVPGVMREINSIVSDVGANITSQYLSTDSNIGFVVMDMERGRVEEAAIRIGGLTTSIKTRIL